MVLPYCTAAEKVVISRHGSRGVGLPPAEYVVRTNVETEDARTRQAGRLPRVFFRSLIVGMSREPPPW